MFWAKKYCREWKKAMASTCTEYSVHIDSTPNINSIRTFLIQTCSERTLTNAPSTSWRGVLQPLESGWGLPSPNHQSEVFHPPFISYLCVSAYLHHRLLKGRDFVFHIPVAILLEVDFTVSNLEIPVLREALWEDCLWIGIRLSLKKWSVFGLFLILPNGSFVRFNL